MLKHILSAAGALALTAGTLALSTPAHAAPAEDSVAVRIADLDMSNAADSARFDRRVQHAAREVCGWASLQEPRIKAQSLACERDAVAGARSDLRVAMEGKSGATVLALRN
jgi:UrcA family protein